MKQIVGGLALFSMFFGAGNLVFPLMLGEAAGSENVWAMLGLCTTAVIFPLMGLFAVILFNGDRHSFFRRIGRWPAFLLYGVMMLSLGPLGSTSRLYAVSYASVKPYLPIGLLGFSLLAGAAVYLLIIKKQRLVDLLGAVLTPVLLLSLGMIVALGLWIHPEPTIVEAGAGFQFTQGLRVGYGTLDLLAAFVFGQLIYGSFEGQTSDRKQLKKMFLQASFIAAFLLAAVYGGLSYVASYWGPTLGEVAPEDLLGAIALKVLGPAGALVSGIAVAMACLTTALSLTTSFGDWLEKDLFRDRLPRLSVLVVAVGSSVAMANLGFSGIMAVVGPILEVIYPGLILLTMINIGQKLGWWSRSVVKNRA